MNALQKLLDFLSKLHEHKISYRLSNPREESIMAVIDVPGERWEVEFFADGHVEVEVFKTTVEIEGEEALARLFEKYSD